MYGDNASKGSHKEDAEALPGKGILCSDTESGQIHASEHMKELEYFRQLSLYIEIFYMVKLLNLPDTVKRSNRELDVRSKILCLVLTTSSCAKGM